MYAVLKVAVGNLGVQYFGFFAVQWKSQIVLFIGKNLFILLQYITIKTVWQKQLFFDFGHFLRTKVFNVFHNFFGHFFIDEVFFQIQNIIFSSITFLLRYTNLIFDYLFLKKAQSLGQRPSKWSNEARWAEYDTSFWRTQVLNSSSW